MDEGKFCPKCKIIKSLSNFCKDSARKCGLQSYCRDCHKISKKNDYEMERDDYRDRRLRNRYGLSLKDFNRMLDSQNNSCMICDNKISIFEKSNLVYVDHNHTTGEVRGLLCNTCNWGIGSFKDSPYLLKKAAAYLEGFYLPKE